MSRDDLSMLLTQLSDADLRLEWNAISSSFGGRFELLQHFAREHACSAERDGAEIIFRRSVPAAPEGLSPADGMPLQDEHAERAPRSGDDGWAREDDEPSASDPREVR